MVQSPANAEITGLSPQPDFQLSIKMIKNWVEAYGYLKSPGQFENFKRQFDSFMAGLSGDLKYLLSITRHETVEINIFYAEKLYKFFAHMAPQLKKPESNQPAGDDLEITAEDVIMDSLCVQAYKFTIDEARLSDFIPLDSRIGKKSPEEIEFRVDYFYRLGVKHEEDIFDEIAFIVCKSYSDLNSKEGEMVDLSPANAGTKLAKIDYEKRIATIYYVEDGKEKKIMITVKKLFEALIQRELYKAYCGKHLHPGL